MEDFNNNNHQTPETRGEEYTGTQQSNQPQQSYEAQSAYGQQQAEPRTPYQTPVQHPDYVAPQQRADYGAPGQDSAPQHNVPPQYQNGAVPPQPPKKHKKHGRTVVIGLCSVAAACLLFAGGAFIGHFVNTGDGGAVTASAQSGDLPTVQLNSTPDYDPDNYDVVNGLAGEEIYKKVSPSIVSVIATVQGGTGSGSGVIMSSDGYIITNNHVVEDAQSVAVQLSDGTQYDATIIGTDEQTDLAVIKVEPEGQLTAAEFGNSDELQPGEYAYAIGSPGGVQFANTITGGRISAINRDVTINDRVMTLIQTDASINPGNSGGALINKYGQVVGITSAKLSSNTFSEASIEGMGFAIPINTTKEIVDELIENGYVVGRPSIGITGSNVESADGSIAGVQVYSIDSRAKAASEGLQVGDVITAVNGTPTPTMDDVNAIKEDMKAGDKITLTVYRISTGKTLNLTVTLTDAHDLEGEDPAEESTQNSQSGNSQYPQYQNPFSYFGW